MKKHNDLIQLLCFSLFIALFAVLLLVLPSRSFSETENRVLAGTPDFSLSAFFSGDFGSDFERWITDQFPFRDSWVSLKARAERLSGKTENNGVFFCGEETLMNRFPEPDERSLDSALDALRALSEHADCPVYLSLIPSSAAVWPERLPAHADTADEPALIKRLYSSCGVNTIDTLSALKAHADEDIFYRTDHHWTTLGAYYAYAAAAGAMGLSPVPLSEFTPETVSDSFYGTIYSSSGVRWLPPDSIQRFVPDAGAAVTKYEGPDEISVPVYDAEKLGMKDKYSYFFGGNTPRMVIRTGQEGGRLLLIRDSYSDCELPFFFAHFSEIHVLDLRYYRQSVAEYIRANGFDGILVNYGLSDFVSDSSVFLMGC